MEERLQGAPHMQPQPKDSFFFEGEPKMTFPKHQSTSARSFEQMHFQRRRV